MPTRPASYVRATRRPNIVEANSRTLGSVPAYGITGVPTEIGNPGLEYLQDVLQASGGTISQGWNQAFVDGVHRYWTMPEITFDLVEGFYTLNIFGCFNFSREPDLSQQAWFDPPHFCAGFHTVSVVQSGVETFQARGKVYPWSGTSNRLQKYRAREAMPCGATGLQGTYQQTKMDGYFTLPFLRGGGTVTVVARLLMMASVQTTASGGTHDPNAQVYDSNVGVLVMSNASQFRVAHGIQSWNWDESSFQMDIDRVGP